MESPDLKRQTARTLKWNLIDRLSSQLLYGVTGIVLARLLSQDDFGLVGAMLVFQAFASLFVDSGFSSALIQRKSPSRLDYSTVLWFNVAMACGIYAVLWFSAPLIADWFQGDERLIPLSRVMFLSFIITSTLIVQTNRLMKLMDVKPVAVANTAALAAGAVVGISLAFGGYGAWAIVWQTLTVSAVKSLILWMCTRWVPLWGFSWRALRSFFAVGSGVMLTSFLNTLFQNIYSFFIGNRVGLVSLGYYTQADKWSKMGVMSVAQTLTASFLPVLSEVQDDNCRFARVAAKTNRFTGYITFPAMGFLIVMATPIFHLLFGEKWDASIVLFQLLLVRGVFTILSSLYSNYALSLGKAKLIVYMEVMRDVAALAALVATLPYISLSTPGDIVCGVKILLWGQVAASALTWIATLIVTAPMTGRHIQSYLVDYAPYSIATGVIMCVMWGMSLWIKDTLALLALQGVTAVGLYLVVNYLAGSTIQRDALAYLGARFTAKGTD